MRRLGISDREHAPSARQPRHRVHRQERAPRTGARTDEVPGATDHEAQPRRVPQRPGRLDLLVDVCERLGRVILHGAEAWQLREVVRQVADRLAGTVGPEGSVEAVRARARRLVDTILLLHPARGPAVRDAVRAEIVWCRVPAGPSWIGAHPDDPVSFDAETPGKWVQVVRDVEMGRDPVTNALYERFDPEHAAERGTSAKRPLIIRS